MKHNSKNLKILIPKNLKVKKRANLTKAFEEIMKSFSQLKKKKFLLKQVLKLILID